MGRIVVVAEKPSVARDIARVLKAGSSAEGFLYNDTYAVTWAIGHLVALCEPGEMNEAWKKWSFDTLPMLPTDMKKNVLPKTKKQFNVIKKLICDKNTDSVICATDSGREGELIFRLIYDMAGCRKPAKRLWVSSMTDEALKEGFAGMKDIGYYDTLYQSARCRSEADWLVGMNASRAFTLKYGVKLSIGRVQTPTLAILVKRRKEIENFVPDTYFEVNVDYPDFKAQWYDEKNKTTRIKEKDKADAIAAKIKGKTALIQDVTTERKSQIAPQLYDLTTLQRDANSYYGLSAAKTLDIAQSLYEKYKLITYPRTDSKCLPEDMTGKIQTAVRNLPQQYKGFAGKLLEKGFPHPKRVFDNTKITDHHAIVTTGKAVPSGLPELEGKIFDLVARRQIAAFYPPYLYDATTILAKCEGETLRSTGTMVADKGWKEVYEGLGKEKKQDAPLPSVQKGDMRDVKKAQVKEKKTEPPKPHTEASLLSQMENAGREIEDEALRESMRESGLGTPATRAAIIERLIEVGYAKRQAKNIVATDKGVHLIEVVPAELSSPETTGRLERALNLIYQGKMEPERFRGSIDRFSAFLVDFAKTKAPKEAGFAPEARVYKTNAYVPGVKCPLCGERIIENERAFGCSKWREGCKFTIWRNAGERMGAPLIDKKMLKALLTQGKAETENGVFVFKEAKVTFLPNVKTHEMIGN